jgi:DASH complex subunit DAD1
MTHTNVLNRKLEEVHGVGKEFTTVAGLWGVSRVAWTRSQADMQRFNQLVKEQQSNPIVEGIPGTGRPLNSV